MRRCRSVLKKEKKSLSKIRIRDQHLAFSLLFLVLPADVAACMGVSPWESTVQGPGVRPVTVTVTTGGGDRRLRDEQYVDCIA